MSSHGDDDETCEFGHTFEINGDPDADISENDSFDADDLEKAVKNGEIQDLEDVKEATGADHYFLRPIMGEAQKTVKLSAGSQGTPHTFILAAADKFGDEVGWDTTLSEEQIFISPQSQFHNDYLQKKQQAEQQVKQAMQGIEQLKKQKHMLEHDIRKLRSRVEDLREGDETVLKGDFVQLVDGAGAQGQGADQQAMRFLRDQNFYPTIVSDFYEMDSVEDLKSAEQKAHEHSDKDEEDFEDGNLSDLPANEKAVLKKKYTMYEKWKDMFGSEVQKKLKEIKGELKRVERALEEAEDQVEEPVRDMVMINQKSQGQLKNDIGQYFSFQRHSTEVKQFEFIASKPVKQQGGNVVETDEDSATHYKIYYIHAIHVNIAGSEDPRTPQEGPTTAKIFWFPAIVCEHVYDNIFAEKKSHLKDRYEEVMADYTGEFDNGDGKDLRDAREEAELSVRELRREVGEEVDDDEEVGEPPLEFSAAIRRIEDGFEPPEAIKEKFDHGDAYLEALNEILDTSFGENDDEENHNEFESGLQKKMKIFFGSTNSYYMPDSDDKLVDVKNWFKYNYYYDIKKGFGLYTMK